MVNFKSNISAHAVDDGILLRCFADISLYPGARRLYKDCDGADGVNFDFGHARGDISVLNTTLEDALIQRDMGLRPILRARLAGNDAKTLNSALGVLIRYGREHGFGQLYTEPRSFSLQAYNVVTSHPAPPRAPEDHGWHIPLKQYGSHDFQEEIQEATQPLVGPAPFHEQKAKKWFVHNKHGKGSFDIRSGWRLTDKHETDNDVGIVTAQQKTGWICKNTPLKVTLAYHRKSNALEAYIEAQTPAYFEAALYAAEDIASEFKTHTIPTLRVIPTNLVATKAAAAIAPRHDFTYDENEENVWVYTGEYPASR